MEDCPYCFESSFELLLKPCLHHICKRCCEDLQTPHAICFVCTEPYNVCDLVNDIAGPVTQNDELQIDVSEVERNAALALNKLGRLKEMQKETDQVYLSHTNEINHFFNTLKESLPELFQRKKDVLLEKIRVEKKNISVSIDVFEELVDKFNRVKTQCDILQRFFSDSRFKLVNAEYEKLMVRLHDPKNFYEKAKYELYVGEGCYLVRGDVTNYRIVKENIKLDWCVLFSARGVVSTKLIDDALIVSGDYGKCVCIENDTAWFRGRYINYVRWRPGNAVNKYSVSECKYTGNYKVFTDHFSQKEVLLPFTNKEGKYGFAHLLTYYKHASQRKHHRNYSCPYYDLDLDDPPDCESYHVEEEYPFNNSICVEYPGSRKRPIDHLQEEVCNQETTKMAFWRIVYYTHQDKTNVPKYHWSMDGSCPCTINSDTFPQGHGQGGFPACFGLTKAGDMIVTYALRLNKLIFINYEAGRVDHEVELTGNIIPPNENTEFTLEYLPERQMFLLLMGNKLHFITLQGVLVYHIPVPENMQKDKCYLMIADNRIYIHSVIDLGLFNKYDSVLISDE